MFKGQGIEAGRKVPGGMIGKSTVTTDNLHYASWQGIGSVELVYRSAFHKGRPAFDEC